MKKFKEQFFVSNSSSSSFCLLGMTFSELRKYLPCMETWSNEDGEECNTDDYIESKIDDSDLSVEYGIADFYDEKIIGIPAYSLDNDKTINQSKKDIVEKIDKLFNCKVDKQDIGFCMDGGYNG